MQCRKECAAHIDQTFVFEFFSKICVLSLLLFTHAAAPAWATTPSNPKSCLAVLRNALTFQSNWTRGGSKVKGRVQAAWTELIHKGLDTLWLESRGAGGSRKYTCTSGKVERATQCFILLDTEIERSVKVLPLQSGSGPLQNDGFPKMHLIAASPMSSYPW